MAGCNATSGFGGPSFGGLGNSEKWGVLVFLSLLWSLCFYWEYYRMEMDG